VYAIIQQERHLMNTPTTKATTKATRIPSLADFLRSKISRLESNTATRNEMLRITDFMIDELVMEHRERTTDNGREGSRDITIFSSDEPAMVNDNTSYVNPYVTSHANTMSDSDIQRCFMLGWFIKQVINL
jgi:hypothetical protein